MSNFIQRLITGIIFVSLIILCLLMGKLTTIVLFSVIIAFSTLEFYIMIKQISEPVRWLGVAFNVSFFYSIVLYNENSQDIDFVFVFTPFILGIILFFIIELYRKSKTQIQNVVFLTFPVIYIVLPFICLYFTPYSFSKDFSTEILIYYFVLVWSNDTFAYLIGKKFGKHKLFESISPKKTWEGTIGGILSTVILAVSISLFYQRKMFLLFIVSAIMISVFSTIGDLIESMFKRNLKVKNSSNLIKGHGGFLDRFDSVFISAPLYYLTLYYFHFSF